MLNVIPVNTLLNLVDSLLRRAEAVLAGWANVILNPMGYEWDVTEARM